MKSLGPLNLDMLISALNIVQLNAYLKLNYICQFAGIYLYIRGYQKNCIVRAHLELDAMV